jgi:autotransporter-associated beta strand protein
MDGEGDIVITGVIEELTASVLTVLKTGNGSLTLGGANTYTGVTTVNAGTLLVTGSTAAASTVNVNNTSTLGGNGTIGGVVNVASTAFLVPGTSIDTLTVNGNVDLNGALLVEIDELDVNVNDLLDVNALLDITGAAVNFDITGALTQIAYIFATYDDLVGTFTGGDNAPAGYTIDYAYQGNNIALVLIPVPAAMPAGLALLGTVILRRHRLA